MKKVLDNREFWKTMKPFSSDKNTIFSKISIQKNNKITSDGFDWSKDFSTFLKMLLDGSMSSQMITVSVTQKI